MLGGKETGGEEGEALGLRPAPAGEICFPVNFLVKAKDIHCIYYWATLVHRYLGQRDKITIILQSMYEIRRIKNYTISNSIGLTKNN